MRTELCKFWLRGQTCENRDKEQGCGFAHGEHELQPKHGLNEKYLTSVCKNFLEHPSKCSYGDRCIFQHPTMDPREKQPIEAIFRSVMMPASSRNSGGGGSRNDAKPSIASTASQLRRREMSEPVVDCFQGRTVIMTANASEFARPYDKSSGSAIEVAAGGASSNSSRTTLPLVLPTVPDWER